MARGASAVTTDSKHGFRVAENLLARSFDHDARRTALGHRHHVHLDRRGLAVPGRDPRSVLAPVVGWATERTLDTPASPWRPDDGTDAATACAGLLHHSDRGSQYASDDYQRLLERHGIVCSMSRKRQLLGQCRGRELLRHPQTGTGVPLPVAHASRGPQRGVRIHRAVSTTVSAGIRRSVISVLLSSSVVIMNRCCLTRISTQSGQPQREKLERWRQAYNQVRPHSSLANRAPSEFARLWHKEWNEALARTAGPAEQKLASAVQCAAPSVEGI